MTWKPPISQGGALILPDVNLLVYAVDETSSFHGAANTWLGDVLSSANPFRIERRRHSAT